MDNTDWIVGGPQGDIKKELFNPMSLLVIVITAGSFILNAVMGVLKGWTYPVQEPTYRGGDQQHRHLLRVGPAPVSYTHLHDQPRSSSCARHGHLLRIRLRRDQD